MTGPDSVMPRTMDRWVHPDARARWRRDADVVVVGSGAAGISAALTAAASGLRVLVVVRISGDVCSQGCTARGPSLTDPNRT